jgi:hypothetical protein
MKRDDYTTANIKSGKPGNAARVVMRRQFTAAPRLSGNTFLTDSLLLAVSGRTVQAALGRERVFYFLRAFLGSLDCFLTDGLSSLNCLFADGLRAFLALINHSLRAFLRG